MYRHIDLYVNEYSVDLGQEGRRAVEMLFERAGATGVIPAADRRRCFFREDRVQLLHALGEARRPGLQDVGRLDLVDAIVAHRAHAIPSRPRPNPVLLHLLPAPRREDDLRIAARDLRRVDDAIAREAGVGELRERSARRRRSRRAPRPSGCPRSAGRPIPRRTRAAARKPRGGLADAIEIGRTADPPALRLRPDSRPARRASESSAGSRRRCAG